MSLDPAIEQLLTKALTQEAPELAAKIISTSIRDNFLEAPLSLEFLELFTRFQAIKILLYSIQNKLQYLQQSSSLPLRSYKGTATDFADFIANLSIEPVLTAHPTEPLAEEVIILLEEIEQHFYHLELLLPLLQKLLRTPLVPLSKRTVEMEVADNLHYFGKIYASYDLFIEKVAQAYIEHFKQPFPSALGTKLKDSFLPRSWAGGDADGNIRVTAEMMAKAAAMHIASGMNIPIDVRQSAQMLYKAEAGDQNELQRFTVMQQYPNIFRKLIISNVESSEDIMVAIRLAKKFALNVEIIPLFESYNALKNAAQIIIKTPEWQDETIMVGYSDSEKEAGIFVLAMLDEAIAEIKEVISPRQLKVFHGCGLDLGRGGPYICALQQTVQGNHKRFAFSNPESIANYFMEVFNPALKPMETIKPLKAEVAIDKYRRLLIENNKQVNQYLQTASPFRVFVQPCNFSSRSTKRNQTEEDNPFSQWVAGKPFANEEILKGLRAISQVNSIEGSWSYFNLWYGADQFDWQQSSERVDDLRFKALYGLKAYDYNMQQLYDVQLDMQNHLAQEYDKISALFANQQLPAKTLKILEEKELLFAELKRLMTYITKAVITDQKSFHQLFHSNLNESENSKKLLQTIGAIYVAFTEYRTVGYSFSKFFMASLHKN